MIELYLFTVDPAVVTRATAAGINAFVIDWENRSGFPERSVAGSPFDLPEDEAGLQRVAAFPGTNRLCRLNPLGAHTVDEVARAVAAGATHVLLPMVETAQQAEEFLDIVYERAAVGVMIETAAACQAAGEIARLPLDFVYVGLLDLAVSRREGNIFRAVADGTADYLRRCFHRTKFGIGGLTVIDGGSPVPCLELMAELARLQTDFCFLRNSFQRDAANRDWPAEVERIRASWAALEARGPTAVEQAHESFIANHGASAPRLDPAVPPRQC